MERLFHWLPCSNLSHFRGRFVSSMRRRREFFLARCHWRLFCLLCRLSTPSKRTAKSTSELRILHNNTAVCYNSYSVCTQWETNVCTQFSCHFRCQNHFSKPDFMIFTKIFYYDFSKLKNVSFISSSFQRQNDFLSDIVFYVPLAPSL